ncbi:MAG: hypothetical protein AB7H80_14885, partial [Candidatus Kapaibacterium sp.]
MADRTCAERGIPPHLHNNNRDSDPFFAEEEQIYVRVRRDPQRAYPPDWVVKDIGTSKDNSTLRAKYCRNSSDARYDNSGNQYPHFAIGMWIFGRLNSIRHSQTSSEKTATIEVEHTPMQCQYPHSDVRVLINGERIGDTVSISKSLKSLMREDLADALTIVELPVGDAAAQMIPKPQIHFDDCLRHQKQLTTVALRVAETLLEHSAGMNRLNQKFR